MFQDEGASTDVTGTEVFFISSMTAEKGSRTSPVKLKPDVVVIVRTWETKGARGGVFLGVHTKDGIHDVVCLIQGG